MFGKMGDIMGMMSKMKEAKEKAEEAKNEMAKEFLTFKSKDESIEIVINLNGEIKNLTFNILDPNLNQKLISEINFATSSVKRTSEEKLKEILKENMPNIPGLPEF